jgi:cytochrome d ubiquinol oxidase subunit I
MLNASLLTSAFLVTGVSASRMIRKVDGPATMRVLRTGILLAAVLAPVQVLIGDQHGLNTLEHQPAKIAAIEGIWHTESGAPLTLFGFPDEDSERTRFALEIPHGASLILTHDVDGELQGLDAFTGRSPPVAIVFWAFRLMVGMGLAMIAASWWGALSLLRRRALSTVQLKTLSLMTFSGWVATLAGWYVTEVGRQPWLVYGELRAADVVASHSVGTMSGTLIAYAGLYAFLLTAFIATLRHLSTKPAASLKMLGPVERNAGDGRRAEGA